MSSQQTPITQALSDLEQAVQSFMISVKGADSSWLTAPAPNKWNPSQVTEHVARSLEEAANDLDGKESRMLSLPFFLKPVARLLFNGVIKKGKLSKAKTNPAMNPASGPATVEEGIARIEQSRDRLVNAARNHASLSMMADSVTFGKVPLDHYIRFQELHVTHHRAQLPSA